MEGTQLLFIPKVVILPPHPLPVDSISFPFLDVLSRVTVEAGSCLCHSLSFMKHLGIRWSCVLMTVSGALLLVPVTACRGDLGLVLSLQSQSQSARLLEQWPSIVFILRGQGGSKQDKKGKGY